MALDISKIKSRLSSLSNANNKSNLMWKPSPGNQVVRIVPYDHNPNKSSFIELKFHYNLNGKTYLSPDSFNRPDPIVEWANRLKTTGDKEDWKLGRKMEPKLRTYVPIIVRGAESEGIKFWGFGKTVYEELLNVVSDPDYGDITDLETGRDITVEFKEATETGKSYPETSVRPKPKATPAVADDKKHLLDNQVNILDLFPEYSYEELRELMNVFLNQDANPTETPEKPIGVVTAGKLVSPAASPTAGSADGTTADVEAKFDALFAKKTA